MMTSRFSGFLRRHVLGLIAIFIALGGTAIALPGTNTVNSGDIINGSVGTQDLHNGAVNESKIAGATWHQVAANPGDSSDPCVGSSPQTGMFCGVISQSLDIVRWRNYGGQYETARFTRDSVGEVHIEGLVQQQTGGSAQALDQTTIFILPPGDRPSATLIVPVTCYVTGGDGHGRIDILANGSVVWQAYDKCIPGNYISLSGISFAAEQ